LGVIHAIEGIIPRFRRAFCGYRLLLSTRENDFGRGSPSLGQARRPILLFKNEGAARALVCSGVTHLKKRLFLNVRRKRLLVSPFGKKFCDINERHNPFWIEGARRWSHLCPVGDTWWRQNRLSAVRARVRDITYSPVSPVTIQWAARPASRARIQERYSLAKDQAKKDVEA